MPYNRYNTLGFEPPHLGGQAQLKDVMMETREIRKAAPSNTRRPLPFNSLGTTPPRRRTRQDPVADPAVDDRIRFVMSDFGGIVSALLFVALAVGLGLLVAYLRH